MVVNHAQTPLGVRTRSMTLELKRLQKLPASPSATSAAIGDGGSYLQLRSRRVERLSPFAAKAKTRKILKGSTSKSQGTGPASENQESEKDKGKGPMLEENENEEKNNNPDDLKVMESSWGENNLEAESAERATRETTPVHLIRDPNALVLPPFSSTRRRYIRTTRANPRQFINPVEDYLNALFGDLEERHKNKCIEKYNFDFDKEEPLPGRYEWEKLMH
ncbi:cyclin-dependent kinase inhibitor 4 [Coffea arabica]|uniref:Cyclin-dependent kinase inhibitor 4 n=1 Tax=Coffea arabica TaxID=13443 RepID=A0A6P6WK05_COFAR|nr:cyclin-dependent kinase inhibitor 4-like [Coffea arabica]